jgi:hypothetical protein
MYKFFRLWVQGQISNEMVLMPSKYMMCKGMHKVEGGVSGYEDAARALAHSNIGKAFLAHPLGVHNYLLFWKEATYSDFFRPDTLANQL